MCTTYVQDIKNISSCLILLCLHSCSCNNYTNITEPWRNKLYTSSSFSGFPKDDAHLVGKWWRFTGIGGDRIITACLTGTRAGGHYTTHFQFTYPTNESETVAEGTAYGDISTCQHDSIRMQSVLCPGGFYIYKPLQDLWFSFYMQQHHGSVLLHLSGRIRGPGSSTTTHRHQPV
uniref:Uncharacterized protein n=1 Tax=Amphiprion percula TaxID=161767 RepID=A0A3P8SFA6_AMPPE